MNDAHVPRRTGRRAGAVVAGLLVIIVVTTATDVVLHATGVFPPWDQRVPDPLLVLATAYRIVFGVAGGYLTARLAPDKPMAHAVALGIVGIVLSTAGAVATWNAGPQFEPKWYPLVLIVTALPSTWVGGRLAGNAA